MQSYAFVATWLVRRRRRAFPAGAPDMIDFGSTPPTAEFNPTSRTHLANYRRVYRASEDRARAEADPKAALRSYLAAYDEIGASKIVIKARDVETTFGLKI